MLAEPIDLPCPRRAWVTIVDEEPSAPTLERSLLTDKAIAEDWNRPEEDAAWAHLHEDR